MPLKEESIWTNYCKAHPSLDKASHQAVLPTPFGCEHACDLLFSGALSISDVRQPFAVIICPSLSFLVVCCHLSSLVVVCWESVWYTICWKNFLFAAPHIMWNRWLMDLTHSCSNHMTSPKYFFFGFSCLTSIELYFFYFKGIILPHWHNDLILTLYILQCYWGILGVI
jgi:hypothetical protein